jgi:DNA (cytosine-5)-methyltransferase 1
MLTFGSLFSGIGGMDLGLERAGMRCVWQVEIDPFCQCVLRKHWPGVKRHEDIRTFSPRDGTDQGWDLLCGGFPCQPVSKIGKRRGSDDVRWLWPEFARVIRLLGPRWVLVENVRGLLSADNGRLFGSVLGDLAACGYDAEWDCIPATAVGAYHERDRIFLVAYPHVTGLEGPRVFGPTPYRTRWNPEPAVGRVADGTTAVMDRLRALGNAVVPQAAEWIAGRILAREHALTRQRKEV